jgi:hypothetical protein
VEAPSAVQALLRWRVALSAEAGGPPGTENAARANTRLLEARRRSARRTTSAPATPCTYPDPYFWRDAMSSDDPSRRTEYQRTRIAPFERFQPKSRPARTPGTCSCMSATLRPNGPRRREPENGSGPSDQPAGKTGESPSTTATAAAAASGARPTATDRTGSPSGHAVVPSRHCHPGTWALPGPSRRSADPVRAEVTCPVGHGTGACRTSRFADRTRWAPSGRGSIPAASSTRPHEPVACRGRGCTAISARCPILT